MTPSTLPALDLGHQEAEAVERMRDVLSAEAQRQHRDRRVGDARERLEPVAGRKVEVDLVHAVRGRGVDRRASYSSVAWNAAPTVHPLGPARSWVTGARSRISACSSRASASGSSCRPVAERDHPAGDVLAGRVLVALAAPASCRANAFITEPCVRSRP